jgi:hypothetical protein
VRCINANLVDLEKRGPAKPHYPERDRDRDADHDQAQHERRILPSRPKPAIGHVRATR